MLLYVLLQKVMCSSTELVSRKKIKGVIVFMSLRDTVYKVVMELYKSGEQVNPYVVISKCGAVNAVFHILDSFADEGILIRRFSVMCRHCGCINSFDGHVFGKYICPSCGREFSIDDSNVSEFYVP